MLHAVGYLSFVFNNLIFVTEEFIRALIIQGSLLTYFLLIVLVFKGPPCEKLMQTAEHGEAHGGAFPNR